MFMIKFFKAYFLVFSFFTFAVTYSSDFEKDIPKISKKRKAPDEDINLDKKHHKALQEEESKEEVKHEGKATTEEVDLQPGTGTKKTGGGAGGHYWKVLYNNIIAGKAYINLIDTEPLGKHASLQVYLNKKSQGKGIGRIVYARACELSSYDDVYAYMSKKNKASFKAASAAGFTQVFSHITRQIIMHWSRKKKSDFLTESSKANTLNFNKSTYSDFSGTYDVTAILAWAMEHQEQAVFLKTEDFLGYVSQDTWGDPQEPPRSNLDCLMNNPKQQQRVREADFSYPIVVTNDHRIIDGVHRVFKSIKEGQENIKSLFMDQQTLDLFRINQTFSYPETGLTLPIPDRYLRVPKDRLSVDPHIRREQLESYFSDHLPSAIEEDNSWLICLERPQERYGCYLHDKSLASALKWWRGGTQVHDIPFEKRLFTKGLLAIEDQWMPYSWSRYFEKNKVIPSEIVLLHLDDHQDMMNPLIGKRIDGKLFDYITGNALDLNRSSSVEGAILSGAIGKGNILLPLIWSVDKINVRHLCFRPHPCSTYRIEKITLENTLLSKQNNRISLRLEPTNLEAAISKSNYIVTPDIEEFLDHIPDHVPILFHIDMDYFNNKFDGNSNWKKENKRVHDLQLREQMALIEKVFIELEKKGLCARIVDTCIGISPGFYPAKFWEKTVPKVIEEARKRGMLDADL
jgi:hypothetical protein